MQTSKGLRGSHTDQGAESIVAECGPTLPGERAREGVPTFSRITGLRAHLFHRLVEEVFASRGVMGLEPAFEVGK